MRAYISEWFDMIKKYTVFALLFVLCMSIGFVAAQDVPQPGTPEENECYPGGVLYRSENQDGCPTEWYWKAGWYLAAYNHGRISRDDVPDEFTSALPPPEQIIPPSPPVIFDDNGVLTICHYYSGSLSNHCLRADLTGTVISTLPEFPTYFYYLIIPTPYTCPSMSGSAGLRSEGIIGDWSGFGFTADEFAQLGFDGTYGVCEYNYLGNW